MTSNPNIQSLRTQIDEIDRQIALLLSDRTQLSEQIWKIKKANKIEFIDLSREVQVIQQISNFLVKTGVESETHQHVLEIFKIMLEKNREQLAHRLLR